MKLSIVIPVYNAAKDLRPCLDSVLGQTLDDFEVICIDDGSTDSSPEILGEYAAKDGRLKVVRQDNAGQGAARNRGLGMATGEYVYFLDADDELSDRNALAYLTGEMRADGLDMLFFDAETVADAGVPSGAIRANSYLRRHEYGGIRTGEEMLVGMCRRNEYSVSPCLVIFRRAFLDTERIRFPEGIIYEDNVFMLKALLSARRVSHRRMALYLRRIHAQTTMTKPASVRNVEGYAACARFAGEMRVRRDMDWRVRRTIRELEVRYRGHVRRLCRDLSLPQRISRSFGEWLIAGRLCLRDHGLGYVLRRLLGGRRKKAMR